MTAPPIVDESLGAGYAVDLDTMRLDEAAKRSEAARERVMTPAQDATIQSRELGIGEAIGNVASDIGRGIPEIPLKLAAGAAETFTADPLDVLADLARATGVGDPEVLENAATATRQFLTDVTAGEPDTVTGEFAQQAGNFMAAFVPILGQFGKTATAVGKINQAAVAGIAADFLTTDTMDEDGLRERFDMARLGAVPGVVIDKTVDFLRVLRKARHSRQSAGGQAGKKAAAEEPKISQEQIGLSDNPDAPFIGRATPGEKKLAQAEAEVRAKLKSEGLDGDALDPDDFRAMVDLEASSIDVNWDHINSADDVKELMQQSTDAFAESVDVSRRHIRTNEATEEAADMLGLSVEDVLARRKGKAMNAEESVAFRKVWGAAADKLNELAEKASGLNGPATDLDQVKFRQMLSIFHAINKEVLGARAEAGRALQSWNINVGGDAERARVMSALLADNGGSKVSQALAKRIAMAQQMGMTPAQISKFAERGWGAKTIDMVKESFVLGLLWTPSTHMVNTVSNAIVPMQQILERGVARGIARVTGEQADSVVAGETYAMMKGWVKGIRAAAHIGAQSAELRERAVSGITAVRGKVDVRTNAISAEAWGIAPDNGWGKMLDFYGSVTRAPGAALQVEDNFFKTIGFTVELEAQSIRQATKEGVQNGWDTTQISRRAAEIFDNPPEHIRLASADAAIYNTFQGDVGWIGKLLMKGREPSMSPAFLIFPFVRTPANLLRYTFERSPLAPLVGQWRGDVAAGGARSEIALARMATGSAMFLAFVDYSYEGHISGPPSRDSGLRAARQRQGMQDSSVRFGDQDFKVNRIDPFGMMMTTAAGIAETMKAYQVEEEDIPEFTEILGAASVVMSDAILDKTWFTGMEQTVSLMQNPKRKAPRYFERLVQSMVPFSTAIRAASSAVEETRAGTSGWKHVQSMIDGFQMSLPRRKDLWGRNIEVDVVNVLSPTRVDTIEPNAIDTEMLAQGISVREIGRTTSFSGVPVNFRQFPRVYETYVELAGNSLEHPGTGRGAFDFLKDLVSGQDSLSTVYDMGSDGPEGRKALMIRSWISRYRELAQDEILRDPDGRFQSEEFTRFREVVRVEKDRKQELLKPVF